MERRWAGIGALALLVGCATPRAAPDFSTLDLCIIRAGVTTARELPSRGFRSVKVMGPQDDPGDCPLIAKAVDTGGGFWTGHYIDFDLFVDGRKAARVTSARYLADNQIDSATVAGIREALEKNPRLREAAGAGARSP